MLIRQATEGRQARDVVYQIPMSEKTPRHYEHTTTYIPGLAVLQQQSLESLQLQL
jgi:hypothetical protein